LAEAGIDPDRIYTHVAFLTRAKYDEFVFGWGIGGTYVTNNPYRLATEDPASLKAYRKFLKGRKLVEGRRKRSIRR
jgi:hypothetical protein